MLRLLAAAFLSALLVPGCQLITSFSPRPCTVSVFVPDFRTSGDEPAPVDGAALSFEARDVSELWLLLLSGLVRSPLHGSEPTHAEIAFSVNGIVQGVGGAGGTAEVGSFQHFMLITGETGSYDVEVTLRSDGPDREATVEDLSIVAARIPPSALVSYLDEPEEQTVPSAGATLRVLEVPASGQEDYLVLAAVEATTAPGTADVQLRIVRPDGTFMPEDSISPMLQGHFGNPDPTPRSFFAAWIESPDADGVLRFSVEAWTLGEEDATVSFQRLLVLRTSELRSIEWNIQDAAHYTNSAPENFTSMSELSVLSPDAPPYLVVQTIVLGSAIPTLQIIGPHVIYYGPIDFDEADYTLSFGTVALHESTSPLTLETMYSCCGYGPWCDARAAATFVIGL